MLVVPAIDIMGGKCVRLLRGDYSKEKVFYEDPVEVARLFKDAGIRIVHVVDLDGAKEGFPVNLDIVKKITGEVGLAVQFGGGVRDIKTAELLFSSGIRYVIVGTMAFIDERGFERMLSEYPDRVVVSIDADNGVVKISGWQVDVSKVGLFDSFKDFVSMGVKRVIFTDVSRDGTLEGVDLYTVKKLVEIKGDSELFVAGGISDRGDIDKLSSVGVDGVIVGSAFYNGRITLAEMVEYVG